VIAAGLGFGKDESRNVADGLTNEVSRMLVATMRKLQQGSRVF
jgi:hypothetical protein